MFVISALIYPTHAVCVKTTLAKKYIYIKNAKTGPVNALDSVTRIRVMAHPTISPMVDIPYEFHIK